MWENFMFNLYFLRKGKNSTKTAFPGMDTPESFSQGEKMKLGGLKSSPNLYGP